MLIIAILAALTAVYLIQYRLYRDHSFDGIRYSISLSAMEVFEGDDIFLHEEIANTALLPLPFVKVDAALPDGLEYLLIETNEDGSREEKTAQSVESIFVLRPYQKIRRTWRVHCSVRGEYSIGAVTLVTNDLIGFDQQSRMLSVPGTAKNCLTVLPRTVPLDKAFTASRYLSGDIAVQRSVLSDPLRLCGVREYAQGDPMSRINWKSTAAHQSLMVNVEEFTKIHQFHLVLNMNSRDIERVPGAPSIPHAVEACITLAASILDSVANENIAVRLIANTMSDALKDFSAGLTETDEIGQQIYMSPPYSGTRDMLEALRMLAALPLTISVSIEKMLDHILASPEMYASGGNLVVISAYISERMINFYYAMRTAGIDVIFYITSAVHNAAVIPDDVPVIFKTYFE